MCGYVWTYVCVLGRRAIGNALVTVTRVERPTATDSAALAVRCQHRRRRRHHLYHHHHHHYLRLLPPSPPPRFPCLHLTFPLHPSLSFFHSSYLGRYARARSPMLHVLNPLTPPSYLAQPLPTRTSISATIFLLFRLLIPPPLFSRISIFPF